MTRSARSVRTPRKSAQPASVTKETFSALGRQLTAAGRRQRVVARAAVVLGRAPFSPRPAVDQQPLERGVQRAFTNGEHVGGREPQMLNDAVAVLRAADERLQDQELERAGEQIGRGVR